MTSCPKVLHEDAQRKTKLHEEMFSHLYQDLLNRTNGFQLFDRDSYSSIDYINELSIDHPINIKNEVDIFLNEKGITIENHKDYISQMKDAFLQEVEKYDHPLVNKSRLVEDRFENHILAFQLDNNEQAEKMCSLLKEFRVIPDYEDSFLLFSFALFHDGKFDMSVLNTRRAYFFDELIY